MKRIKDKPGLYYLGELVATGYIAALKELYQLETIPNQFCVNTDYEANGYSVVDNSGIQHIYELSPHEFYEALMNLK